LKAYDGNYRQAVAWYKDKVVYLNSEGIMDISKISDENYLYKMYIIVESQKSQEESQKSKV